MTSGGDVRIGLACAGGVVEGAIYEIGALCALEEAIDGVDFNALDVYVGVSSGALVASLLANGVPPHVLSRALLGEAAEAALNVAPEVLFTPAVGACARRLGRAPAVLYDAARRYLWRPGDLSLLGALAGLGPLVPVGLFDGAPLERHVAAAFGAPGRTDDFRRLSTCLRVVATRLDTAETVVFGEDEAHVPISTAVRASTALPPLYGPVEIDGRHYIDGVARRTMSASVALEAGADLLFCINPIVPVRALVEGRAGDPAGGSLAAHGLPAVLSQAFRTLVHSRMRTGFQRYAHRYPAADLLIIEPDFEERETFFANLFSFASRRHVCERAYRMTRRYLRAERARIAPVLARHGLRLRTHVLEDERRTLPGGLAPWAERNAEQVMRGAHHALDRLDHVLARLAPDEAAAGA